MTTPVPATLPLTGERTVPGIPEENYWFRRHEVVYEALPSWLPPQTSLVLDAGCGEGYGVALTASLVDGARVVGLDYDALTAAHAAAAHAGARTGFVRGLLTALPLPDAAVDAAVSLQVVEHIWTPGEYVAELLRVLRPGGRLVVSTPNRITFSAGLGRRERPTNPFHCREYDAAELAEELARWGGADVSDVTVLGLRHGERLAAWEAEHGPLVDAQLQADPATWPEHLRALVASVRCEDFVLTLDGLEDCLDLVVLATRA